MEPRPKPAPTAAARSFRLTRSAIGGTEFLAAYSPCGRDGNFPVASVIFDRARQSLGRDRIWRHPKSGATFGGGYGQGLQGDGVVFEIVP